ncbi:MAG TPA: hypothetical protein PKH77_19865 [Anaerolineae bacterium]|nr:hypothetical protein [Anaerolineae bacterium]
MYQPIPAPGEIRVEIGDADGITHCLRLTVPAAQTLLTTLQHDLAQVATARYAAATEALPVLKDAVLTWLAAYNADILGNDSDCIDFRYQDQRFELAWDTPENRCVLYTVPDSPNMVTRTLYRVERAQWYITTNAADTGDFLIWFSRMLVV